MKTFIPREGLLDNTYRLLFSEGYRFISNRCERFGTDVFSTRIMLKKAICMLGEEAAEQFYWPGRFTRRGALPRFAFTLIQDFGSVMAMDGEDHHRRKEMFLSMMSPESLASLMRLTAEHWREQARKWETMKRVSLFEEAHLPLCAAACEWAGLHLPQRTIRRRAREFRAMVEGTGSMGPRNWRGHRMRARTERWARRMVRGIRSGRLKAPLGSPAHVICTFHDRNGLPLDTPSAAVELINILRTTVADARYMVFAAMALHAHPEWRDRVAVSDEALAAFTDEVRRYYPFIPFIGGRVLKEFVWRDHAFRENDWVLFDLYGTNHDPRIWGDPGVFRPERFQEKAPGPYDLVSHGAGDRRITHRCPGEAITVEQIRTITRILAGEMSYEVPEQDLRMDLARIPALPNSRFVLANVRLKSQYFARNRHNHGEQPRKLIRPASKRKEEIMAETIHDQINRYLQDTIAAERNFEAALNAFGQAGEQPAVQQLLGSLSSKARTQHERLTALLDRRGGSPSTAKTLLAQMLAFSPLSAQIGQDAPEKNTQHLMVTFAAAAAEMAMYESLAAAAAEAGEEEVLSLAKTLQSEEHDDYKQVWSLLRNSANAAFEKEVREYDDPAKVIARYLEDAIAAEKSFETQLQAFSKEGDDNAAKATFAQHARETRNQYQALTSRLRALGGSPSSFKSFIAHLFNFAPKTAQIGHDATERVTQNLMMAFAVENAEVAMYESLATVAQAAHDEETEQLARGIQQQERETADKVWTLIAPAARRSIAPREPATKAS